MGASDVKVIAGDQGRGNRLDQLDRPSDVLIDKEMNSLFIADGGQSTSGSMVTTSRIRHKVK